MARRRTHRKASRPAPKVNRENGRVFMRMKFSQSEIDASSPKGHGQGRATRVHKNKNAYTRRNKHRGRRDW